MYFPLLSVIPPARILFDFDKNEIVVYSNGAFEPSSMTIPVTVTSEPVGRCAKMVVVMKMSKMEVIRRIIIFTDMTTKILHGLKSLSQYSVKKQE